MFKISEFSKISQVSVKTLRYYDQLHILKPAHTDKFTGYRYYSAEQMFQLHRILAFKELGFSLVQIRRMMSENIPLEQIRGMFRIRQNEIQSIIEKEQDKLTRITERLCIIENEGKDLLNNSVVIKEVEPQLVMTYRQRASLRQIPELFEQLDEHLGHLGLPSRSQMVLWHGCEECEDDIDVEVGRQINHKISTSSPYTVKRLPEVPMMATLIHHCRTTSRCTASTELAFWIERNGYRMKENEPRREICIPHEKLGDPEAFIAEVQIAVERA
ncbi:MerR family transcriptional regulator [Paenibacillus chitinolyticus]|uniref:MerR family transcriptional regulator n=1 Tax=Paenibacillus chitinolyticus TaxID=79263 RepID=UPI0026E4F86C|nr:MerR family transcriptional regulator [Paenibacillus chitinolyticus]GKS13119.1 MerR family transcriptional regulator [Paenibacillus chitinolyticus]